MNATTGDSRQPGPERPDAFGLAAEERLEVPERSGRRFG